MSFVSLSIYPIFNKQVLLCPFYKCRNWGSEWFVNRSKVTQLSTLNLNLIQIQISPTLKLKFLAIIHSGHRQRRKYYFHLSLPPPSFLPASLLKKEVEGEQKLRAGRTILRSHLLRLPGHSPVLGKGYPHTYRLPCLILNEKVMQN